MTKVEFHDALLVGFEAVEAEVRLRMERVCVYEGDRLVRQEVGALVLQGVHDSRIDGQAATPGMEMEYGRVLDWSLDSGAGHFLVDWVGYGPVKHQVRDWTFRFRASRWETAFECAD